jgi:methyl-accepting chemotaxis protein
MRLETKTRPRALSSGEREELERYRTWSRRIGGFCQAVVAGNLEVRLLGGEEGGELGQITEGLNQLLDVTDAFVREAKASLQAASEGRFHRRIMLRGLPGTFRQAAAIINDTNGKMKTQSAELAARQEAERLAAAELREKVDAILAVAKAAAAGDLTREIPFRGDDAIGQLASGLGAFFVELRQNIAGIGENATSVNRAAEELSAISQQMSANAEETSAQGTTVSAAATQVSSNVQTVASGTEEMSASIREIARNAAEATRVARQAVAIATATNHQVAKLGESSSEVGKVIRVITAIAQQTKLLALNATIEAARAGEAGKGFAVVANEVKELAKETAEATEDITRKIATIQQDTAGAVAAIAEIGGIVDQINGLQTAIAGAVEEQTATTNEMSRNLHEGARGTNQIAENMVGVVKAAQDTSEGAARSLGAARELARMATDLQRLVADYKLG